METIKKGSKGEAVRLLRSWLGLPQGDEFDAVVDAAVKAYQRSQGLGTDGIVGKKTWLALTCEQVVKKSVAQDSDYKMLADALGIEYAALRAVVQVETGGKGGFITAGKPAILFEGHIMYAECKALGRNMTLLSKKYPKLIYPKWTKAYYVGGAGEWGRFKLACEIDRACAIKATSWGLFQILGRNYKTCGCSSVEDFYAKMCRSEAWQLVLGIRFIDNSGLTDLLRQRRWSEFAKRYNGSGQVAYYANKLAAAYQRWK